MPTSQLLPASDFNTEWVPTGAATRALALASDDGDTSFIDPNSSSLRRCLCEMANLDPTAWQIIGSVTLKWKGKTNGAWSGSANSIIYDGSYSSGSNHSPWTSSYATYTDTFATQPTGGSAWTVAAVNALRAGMSGDADVGEENNFRVSYLYLEVEWIPMFSGWASMVGGLIGPLIGAAVQLSEIPRLIRAFNRAARGKTIIHGKEAVALFNSLRANPHRAYCY